MSRAPRIAATVLAVLATAAIPAAAASAQEEATEDAAPAPPARLLEVSTTTEPAFRLTARIAIDAAPAGARIDVGLAFARRPIRRCWTPTRVGPDGTVEVVIEAPEPARAGLYELLVVLDPRRQPKARPTIGARPRLTVLRTYAGDPTAEFADREAERKALAEAFAALGFLADDLEALAADRDGGDDPGERPAALLREVQRIERLAAPFGPTELLASSFPDAGDDVRSLVALLEPRIAALSASTPPSGEEEAAPSTGPTVSLGAVIAEVRRRRAGHVRALQIEADALAVEATAAFALSIVADEDRRAEAARTASVTPDPPGPEGERALARAELLARELARRVEALEAAPAASRSAAQSELLALLVRLAPLHEAAVVTARASPGADPDEGPIAASRARRAKVANEVVRILRERRRSRRTALAGAVVEARRLREDWRALMDAAARGKTKRGTLSLWRARCALTLRRFRDAADSPDDPLTELDAARWLVFLVETLHDRDRLEVDPQVGPLVEDYDRRKAWLEEVLDYTERRLAAILGEAPDR